MKIGFLSHLDQNLYLFRLPVMLELKKRGHTPIAIAPEGEYLNRLRELGIECVSYKIERKSLNPLKEIFAIQNIYNAIKPLSLDILHTFTAKPNIYGTIAGRLAGVPTIINLVEGLGSFYLEEDFKSRVVRGLIEMLYKRVFKLSNAVMFVNSDDPRYLMQKGIVSPKKVVKINGVGIDTKEWSFERKKGGELTVVMVSRLIRHKGVIEYLEAARILKREYPAVRFLFVGGEDSGNPSGLKRDIFERFLEVEYLGERDDVRQILKDSDIFVLPSYREGLPRTVLEAMCVGAVVVGADSVGIRDVVKHERTGILVPQKDVMALAKAIERLILEPALIEKMAKEARRVCEREYDIKPIVAAHLRLYGVR